MVTEVAVIMRERLNDPERILSLELLAAFSLIAD